MLAARGWASPHARRLARTGALAAAHPSLAAAWAAGIITSDHVDAVARNTGPLTEEQLAAVIGELGTRWGQWSPPMITRFVLSAIRLLHPPAGTGPDRDEADAYSCRDLSFALLGDTVILSGTLPRLEGEAVIAAIDALAERLRSTADHVPAGARRADALVELVNTAATAGALPTRGGLPVALTVTLEHTQLGDPVWTTSRGHTLTPAEQRFTACDPTLTPITVTTPGSRTPEESTGLGAHCPDTLEGLFDPEGPAPMAVPPRWTAQPGAAPVSAGWIRAHNGAHARRADRSPGRAAVRRASDPAGRRTHLPDRHPRPTQGPGHPRRRMHHPRMPDPGRELPSPPRHRLGRRRALGHRQPRPALLDPPPPSRPQHVDHPPPPNPADQSRNHPQAHHPKPPGPPTTDAPWTITRTHRTRWRL